MQWKREVSLADGRVLLLRSLEEKDAQATLYVLRQVMGETPYLTRSAEECHGTVAQEVEFIRKAADNPRGVMLGAFLNEELVGMGSLMPVSPYARMHHRGGLGISVRKPYWHAGIGTAMLDTLLAAGRMMGLEQVELDMVAGNTRAEAMYRRAGFQPFGVHPRAVRYADGSYADVTLMCLML